MRWSAPRGTRPLAKRHAARMGPIVCDLEGPTPILSRSKKLVVANEIVVLNTVQGTAGQDCSKGSRQFPLRVDAGADRESKRSMRTAGSSIPYSVFPVRCSLFTGHRLPTTVFWYTRFNSNLCYLKFLVRQSTESTPTSSM